MQEAGGRQGRAEPRNTAQVRGGGERGVVRGGGGGGQPQEALVHFLVHGVRGDLGLGQGFCFNGYLKKYPVYFALKIPDPNAQYGMQFGYP